MTTSLPNQIDRAVGARLAKLRINASLTQSELAARTDFSLLEIVSYEEGVLRLGAVKMFTLCEVLGVRPADLLDGIQEDSLRPDDRPELNDNGPQFET